MATLFNDVFSQDAFGFVSLTEAINDLPYVEGRIGELGIFQQNVDFLETDVAVIDRTDSEITVLNTVSRGGPPQRAAKRLKNNSRNVSVPHFQFEDRTTAASVFKKRKAGTNVMESAASAVNDQFQHMLDMQLAPTMETHRLGALRGQLLDGDGDVIEDYFDLFGTVQTTFNYNLSSATLKVRTRTHEAIRTIRDILRGVSFTSVYALCGKTFFDEFIEHPSVRDTFLNWSAATDLRENKVQGVFVFGGVSWEDYRGMENLSTATLGKIDDDEAIMFPLGVQGMYRTYYSPADFFETINQAADAMYARVAPDWKYNRWVDQLIETNPLTMNTRPEAVLKITKS